MDANTGWAVGFHGALLHTTDGGETWTRQFGGTFFPLSAVTFVDAQIGTIVGFWGTILRTTTGGK